jgi:NAD(P)-dependent dehydrogenase (short-subunit alcohol dehydrogenase family)
LVCFLFLACRRSLPLFSFRFPSFSDACHRKSRKALNLRLLTPSNPAVVTGGAGQLAGTAARALLEHGLSGLALLDLPSALERSQQRIDALRAEFPAATIVSHGFDIADEASVERAVQASADRLGDLTHLISFAGMVWSADALETSAREFRRVLDVNTTGTWLVAQAVGRYVLSAD